MIKVFLVEDESLVREGIRDSIKWEQLGFEFAGEATDGEIALPMIRKIQPDVLITDIKMPFMDGLDLGRFVAKELPDTKIVIISGYDDFEYARQAIELHVDKYLLKPITKATLTDTLKSIKEQIEQEQEQKDYLLKFNKEVQEYEQYSRRKFFEGLVLGTMPVNELYDRANDLNIDLSAESYNIVLFIPQIKKNEQETGEGFLRIHEELMQILGNDPRYVIVRWNMISFAILIKTNAGEIQELTDKCIDTICGLCNGFAKQMNWYVSSGNPVKRISGLPECFGVANHLLSFRHLYPSEHILTEKITRKSEDDTEQLASFDVAMVDPAVLKSFLQTGLKEEIEGFAVDYMEKLAGAVKSSMFRNYLALNARFNAAIFVKEMGYDADEFINGLSPISMDISLDNTRAYIVEILKKALELRDDETQKKSKNLLKSAIDYIDANFSDDNISLISVSNYVSISPNYFSALFSQELGLTFVEYLTKKRMDSAKMLLRTTSLRSGEVANKVGYRDPRYFSFIFKKTVGCTPRDYRAEVAAK